MAMSLTMLSLDRLKQLVEGTFAGIRARTKLVPAGGPGDKVFPPTYQGGQYAFEERWVDGRLVRTVLLDSVQSQANRMEQALKAAHDRGELRLPMLVVDFAKAGFPHIGKITSLDAPHRIADAIFRDSLLNGVPFRESQQGRRFENARYTDATPIWELCPTALIFGVWDSTGARGGMGTKFARALVSEIVGFDAKAGVKTASRVDPLPIRAEVVIYEAQPGKGAPSGWTTDPNEAVVEGGKPKPYGERGRASEVNLGNVTPDIVRDDAGEALPGGVTISYALHTSVLSLSALRRLRFPLENTRAEAEAVNVAARTALAALGLAAVVYVREQGYDLRSRCLLVPEEPLVFEVLPNDGSLSPERFTLTAAAARDLFKEAVDHAREVGLPWPEPGQEEIELEPTRALVDLVQRSLALVRPVEE